MQQQKHPLSIVSICAPHDLSSLEQWEAHLRPLEQAGHLAVWSERHLLAGASRQEQIDEHLEQANLLVLLLSADFFTDDDCIALMEQAIHHYQNNSLRVLPLLLRPVAWQESPLKGFACLPSNGIPITQWSNQDEAWQVCVQGIKRLLGRRLSRPLPTGPAGKHADPDWERMLRRPRRAYKELLDQSLHGIAWVELGLANPT